MLVSCMHIFFKLSFIEFYSLSSSHYSPCKKLKTPIFCPFKLDPFLCLLFPFLLIFSTWDKQVKGNKIVRLKKIRQEKVSSFSIYCRFNILLEWNFRRREKGALRNVHQAAKYGKNLLFPFLGWYAFISFRDWRI